MNAPAVTLKTSNTGMNNSFRITITSLLLAGTILHSCRKAEDSGLAEMVSKNVKYGTHVEQSLDIYLPAGRTSEKTKTIVFIHGGSWSGGDKADFDEHITSIGKSLSDYAIFNINYRLAGPQARFPAQIEDIQAALDFIESKAADFNIRTDKKALIGASAGAHLALLFAYNHNTDGSVKAVIDLFGPTDLTTLYTSHPVPAASQPVLVNFLGSTPAANPALYVQASPLTFVSGTSPATLILHGDMDFIVPISQSTQLRTKLMQAGAKVEMHTYTGEGHGWFGTTLQDTYNRTIAFVKENVQ